MKSDTEEPEPETDNGDEDVVHYIWDDDPDESMCGKDVTGTQWESDTVPVTCQGCLDAEKFVEEIEARLGGE